MQIKVKLAKRTKKGKSVRTLRRQGIVPGAISMHKKDTLLVQAEYKEVLKLAKASATTLVIAQIEGGDEVTALITEVLVDPIKDEILSFNLTEITEDSKLSVPVPIELVGESPIIKKNLGVLVVSKPFVKLVLNKKNLVHSIKVDLSKLEEIGDTITVEDVLKELGDVKLASYKEINDAIVTVVPLQKTLKEEQEEAEAAEEEVAESAEAGAAPAEQPAAEASAGEGE